MPGPSCLEGKREEGSLVTWRGSTEFEGLSFLHLAPNKRGEIRRAGLVGGGQLEGDSHESLI